MAKEQSLQSVKNGEVKETELVSTPIIIPTAQMKAIEARLDRVAKMTPGIPLQGVYREFEVGEEVRGIFVGFRDIYKDEKALSCAHWIEADRRMYLNAGASLVKQISENGIEPGTAISMTLTGTQRTSNKFDVNVFEVRILNDTEPTNDE